MRNLYTALAAALMASAVATAQPAQIKGLRFTPNKKNLVEAKKSGYVAMLPFAPQQAQGKHKSPVKRAESTIAPLISEQPQGTLHNNLYRSGESFVNMMGGVAQLPFDGVRGCVVVADDNKTIYFKDPIGAYYSEGWIKGERTQGDTIVVKLPQQFVHEEYEDGDQDGYLFKMKPTKMQEDLGDTIVTYTTFVPDADQTVKFVWSNDTIRMINTTQDSKLLGMCNENGEWYGFGDYVSRYEVFNQQPVAPKDGSKAQTVAVTYLESGQSYGRVMKMVKEGNQVYVAGLNQAMPTLWAKGTENGNVITFEGHQYMGLDSLTQSYTFFEPVAHKQVWFDYGDGTGDYYDDPYMVSKMDFAYDTESGVFSSDSTFFVNQGYKRVNQMYTYDEPSFAPWTEKAVTPLAVDEMDMYYSPYTEENGCGYLSFAPSEFDEEGNLLDTEKLFYTIYLDDEPMTFDPEEYPSLNEETTEMPYNFSNQQNIVNYAGMFNVNIYYTGFDSLGVQIIYKGGGEVRKSPITYVSATGDTDAIHQVGLAGKKVVATTYTDLYGRRVSHPTHGVFIQSQRMADGTQKSTKRIF